GSAGAKGTIVVCANCGEWMPLMAIGSGVVLPASRAIGNGRERTSVGLSAPPVGGSGASRIDGAAALSALMVGNDNRASAKAAALAVDGSTLSTSSALPLGAGAGFPVNELRARSAASANVAGGIVS